MRDICKFKADAAAWTQGGYTWVIIRRSVSQRSGPLMYSPLRAAIRGKTCKSSGPFPSFYRVVPVADKNLLRTTARLTHQVGLTHIRASHPYIWLCGPPSGTSLTAATLAGLPLQAVPVEEPIRGVARSPLKPNELQSSKTTPKSLQLTPLLKREALPAIVYGKCGAFQPLLRQPVKLSCLGEGWTRPYWDTRDAGTPISSPIVGIIGASAPPP